MMLPTTEAPAEFHVGAFLTVASVLFSEVSLPQGSDPIRPTLLSVLVGPTGSAKSTVNKAAAKLLMEVDPTVGSVRADGSAQGMTEALITAANRSAMTPDGVRRRQDATDAGLLSPFGADAHGRREAVGAPTLIQASEFTKVLTQAARKATADLTEFYLTLMDGADQETNTRTNALRLVRPLVSVLGDTTPDSLRATLGAENVGNGLLNRMSLWSARYGGEPIPNPPPPDPQAWASIVEDLRLLQETHRHTQMTLSPRAVLLHDSLYRSFLFHRKTSETLGGAVSREDTHLKRYAMLLALLDNSEVIGLHHVEAAWWIVLYQSTASVELAGGLDQSERADALRYLETRIRDRGPFRSNGYLSQALTLKWRGKMDNFGGVAKLVDQLVADGRVFRTTEHGIVCPTE